MKFASAVALLVAPLAVIADSARMAAPAFAQDIFVTAYSTGTIGEYTTSGATVNASLVTGLGFPDGIVASGTDLFVANVDAGAVAEYTTSGTLVNANLFSIPVNSVSLAGTGNDLFVGDLDNDVLENTYSGSPVQVLGGFQAPFSIATSGNVLFIDDAGTNKIVEWNTATGSVNYSFIPIPTGSEGVTVSGNDLFVSFRGLSATGYVSEYNATTGALIATKFITGLYNPTGMQVWRGDFFVLQSSDYAISEYTASGALITSDLITGPVGTTSFVIVPEPSSRAMLLIGVVALLVCGIHKRHWWSTVLFHQRQHA